MLNVIDQYICDLVIDVLKKEETSLTFKEIKEKLNCEIQDINLNVLLDDLTQQGKLKQTRVLTPRGNFTGWRHCDNK